MAVSVSPASISSGNQVLVVEDDPRVRNMLMQALKEMGFAATFSASAEAAGRTLADNTYDTLILDLNLPGMNGIEFLETLRRQGNQVPVIILTGFGDLNAAKKAIHLDVVEFLTKPCTLGTLETAMSRARARRKSQIVTEAAASDDPELRIEPAPPKRPVFTQSVPTDANSEKNPDGSIEELERRHILTLLEKHGGNRTTAAAELGISLRKLYYRLGEYQRKGFLQ